MDEIDVLIYVVDSSDRMRMEEAAAEFIELIDEEKLANCDILVYANKQDIVGAAKDAEVAS
jgi:ADP-ribosylation factor-like protein 3